MQQPISIQQVITKISDLQQKIFRFSHIIGYKSLDTLKNLKLLLSLCNSISIVFLYHGLLQSTTKLLKKALAADVNLFFQGSKLDRKYFGRVLLYCNFSYLLLKIKDYQSSLKFLYDSESLLLELCGENDYSDYKLASSVIGFMAMCKLDKFSNAQEYLEHATEQFNRIIRGNKKSRYNSDSLSKIYCIFTVAGEILMNFQINPHENHCFEPIFEESCIGVFDKIDWKL